MRVGAGPSQNLDWGYYVRSGLAFASYQFVAASVGNYGHVQLLNPAGSGKTVLVHRVYAQRGTAGNIDFSFDNAPRATLSGNWTNLLNGGAVSSAERRWEAMVGQQGTLWRTFGVAANQAYVSTDEWLCSLAAGRGFDVLPDDVNVSITAAVQFAEF